MVVVVAAGDREEGEEDVKHYGIVAEVLMNGSEIGFYFFVELRGGLNVAMRLGRISSSDRSCAEILCAFWSASSRCSRCSR